MSKNCWIFFQNRQTIIEKYQGIEGASSNITDLSEEIFMRHADGEMILWLNLNRSLEEIIRYLEELTKRNGWNLRII